MQLKATHHLCHVRDPLRAVEDCNFFEFGKVMTIFKTSIDRARVFFHSVKAYQQSMSAEFEMPTNQWVTI